MRVLVAFERSGIVRDAFRARGHDAFSCDTHAAESPTEYHFQGDALAAIEGQRWGLIVAHPPCTHLAVSGNRWHAGTQAREDAIQYVRGLMADLDANADNWAIENPVSVISSRIKRPSQTVQPFEFGHPESKRTCLWLSEGLPLLRPTKLLRLPDSGRWKNQTPSGQNKLGPSATRAADRARTYPGIAAAMAEQWG